MEAWRRTSSGAPGWRELGDVFAEIGPNGLMGSSPGQVLGEAGGSQAVLQPQELRECASL